MNCPNCGTQQPNGIVFCDSCGASLSQAEPVVQQQQPYPMNAKTVVAPGDGGAAVANNANCPSCGAAVVAGSAFCDNCGSSLAQQQPSPQPAHQPPQQQPQQHPQPQQLPPQYVQQYAQQPAQHTCSSCGSTLTPDSTFCDMCGAPVGPPSPPAPGPIPHPSPMPPTPTPLQQSSVSARLLVQGSNAVLTFPSNKAQWIVGREDPVSSVFPDIDLTDYGGDEGGVSREHARIYVQGDQFFITDLQSTNYTFVNQQKLAPNQSQPLKDGDELRFGRVKLTFVVQ